MQGTIDVEILRFDEPLGLRLNFRAEGKRVGASNSYLPHLWTSGGLGWKIDLTNATDRHRLVECCHKGIENSRDRLFYRESTTAKDEI